MTDFTPNMTALIIGRNFQSGLNKDHPGLLDKDRRFALTLSFVTRRNSVDELHYGALKRLEKTAAQALMLIWHLDGVRTVMVPEGAAGGHSRFPHSHGILSVRDYEDRYTDVTLGLLNKLMPALLSNIFGEEVHFKITTAPEINKWCAYFFKGYAHSEHVPELVVEQHTKPVDSYIATAPKYRCPEAITLEALVAKAAYSFQSRDYRLFQRVAVRYVLDFRKREQLRRKALPVRPRKPVRIVEKLDPRSLEAHPLLPEKLWEVARQAAIIWNKPLPEVAAQYERDLVRSEKKQLHRKRMSPRLRMQIKEDRHWARKKVDRAIDRYQEFCTTGEYVDPITERVMVRTTTHYQQVE